MKKETRRALSLSMIILGLFVIFLKPITGVTGLAVANEVISFFSGFWFWFIGIGMILVGAMINMAGGLADKVKYEPRLSKELKDALTKAGTLSRFLNDYRQMCTNFMPEKIRIPGKEEEYRHHGKLTSAEKIELAKLGKSYAEAMHNLLELGVKLDREKAQYAVIGGLGVLGHLYEHNKKFSLKFRGTEDIDLLSGENLNPVYASLGFHKIPPERIGMKSIPGRTLDTYIKENPYTDRPVKIQQRDSLSFGGGKRDESKDVYAHARRVSIYGIPISVASDEDLIDTKSGIRGRKDKFGHLKDEHDITHLKDIQKLKKRANP